MIVPLLLAASLASGHLIGPGGLIGPPDPQLTVSQEGDDQRQLVHGQFPWEYGVGVEELLTDAERPELIELRNRHITLSSIAVACCFGGSALAMIGLYTTPAFVDVEHPSPSGLVLPIVISSTGVVIALVSLPLVIFRPGNYEIKTLVYSHNSNLKDGKKLSLIEEVIRPDPLE